MLKATKAKYFWIHRMQGPVLTSALLRMARTGQYIQNLCLKALEKYQISEEFTRLRSKGRQKFREVKLVFGCMPFS